MPPIVGPREGRTFFTPAERLAQDIPGIVDQLAAADAIQALLDQQSGTITGPANAFTRVAAEQGASLVPASAVSTKLERERWEAADPKRPTLAEEQELERRRALARRRHPGLTAEQAEELARTGRTQIADDLVATQTMGPSGLGFPGFGGGSPGGFPEPAYLTSAAPAPAPKRKEFPKGREGTASWKAAVKTHKATVKEYERQKADAAKVNAAAKKQAAKEKAAAKREREKAKEKRDREKAAKEKKAKAVA